MKTFDRVLNWWREQDNVVVNIIAVIGVFLGIWGFIAGYKAVGVEYNLLNSLYATLRLFAFDLTAPNGHGDLIWQLEVSRWFISFFMLYYIVKGVVLILKNKLTLYFLGLSNSEHIIICGAGEKGKTLGLDWLKKDPSINLFYIEPDTNNSNLETLEEAGATIVHGKAQEELILKKLQIHKASHFITTADDTTNMEIIATVANLLKGEEKKPQCFVHLRHSEFYDFFVAKKFNDGKTRLDIKIFNTYNNSARMLFNDKLNQRILGDNIFVDADAIKDKNKQVKLAIFGFGKLGENILLQALHLGHFYNGIPIKVTVVYDQDKDVNANIKDEFNKQYDILKEQYNGKYWDVELIDDGDFVDREMDYTQIVVAYEDEFEALSNLMKLLRRYNDEILFNNIDVAIYSNSFANTADIIQTDKDDDKSTIFKQVRTFGKLKDTCSYDMVIDQKLDDMAILNNKHYNKLHGYDNPNKTAKEEWRDLGMFLQDSNRYLMEHNEMKKSIIEKFIKECKIPYNYEETKKSIETEYFAYDGMKINWDEMCVGEHEYGVKLSVEEIVSLGKLEHIRWNAFHILNGWKKREIPTDTTQIIEKDKIRKLHPCIVSWEELDNVSKNHGKDYKADDIETIMRIPSLEKLFK
ncbi:MAG: NAD-binding protein [Campylobacterota bacterium]|nr:NAD-binding protein [Campylobacterota bacterium]